jgi:hemerythrin
METRNNSIETVLGNDKTAIIAWSDVYKTGIDLIDNQHKELVNLTNELYRACFSTSDVLQSVFKEAMSRMVEYVKFHFSAEVELLARINFPDLAEHKKQHAELVTKILEAAKDHSDGKKFVPNAFVRTLKDWIFSHIAVYDKNYALYVSAQKSKGVLTDEQINH